MKITLKRSSLSKFMYLIKGLGFPALLTTLFFNELNPLPDYLLITSGSIAEGYITRATENSDHFESDVGVRGIKYFYDYEYRFIAPGGKLIKSSGTENGRLPVHLHTISNSGYPVEVEYLAKSPEINRIRGMKSNLKTIVQLVRRKLLGFSLIAIIWSVGIWYIAYSAP